MEEARQVREGFQQPVLKLRVSLLQSAQKAGEAWRRFVGAPALQPSLSDVFPPARRRLRANFSSSFEARHHYLNSQLSPAATCAEAYWGEARRHVGKAWRRTFFEESCWHVGTCSDSSGRACGIRGAASPSKQQQQAADTPPPPPREPEIWLQNCDFARDALRTEVREHRLVVLPDFQGLGIGGDAHIPTVLEWYGLVTSSSLSVSWQVSKGHLFCEV